MVQELKPESKMEKLRAAGAANIVDSMGGNAEAVAATPPATGRVSRTDGLERMKDVARIPLAKIRPDPRQPRTEFDKSEISKLAESMKARGQLQPIVVQWDDADKVYSIVVGERRFRAASEAGMENLVCVIKEGPIEETALRSIQLIENLHRQDLSDVEKARAMKGLIDAHGWSQRTLAKELNLPQGTIAKTLALLTLTPEIQDKVSKGEMAAATGYELSKIKDPVEQAEVAKEVVDSGLGSQGAKALVERQAKSARPAKGRGAAKKPKFKTEMFENTSGFRIRVERKTGIDPSQLHPVVLAWADKIKAMIPKESPQAEAG